MLIKGNQRQRLSTQIKVSGTAASQTRFGVEFEVVIDAEGDGLAAYMGRFGPRVSAHVP